MKTKVMFLIHDLGQGGAEKVLINLVNSLDSSVFDITVIALFAGGINEHFLNDNVHYKTIFKKMLPANSKWMKLFTPKQLHKMYIHDSYDIEISYLEGPCARIISGCENKNAKLVAWIHTKFLTEKEIYNSFRSAKEANASYNRFDLIVSVSKDVDKNFCNLIHYKRNHTVLYNAIDSTQIRILAKENVRNIYNDTFNIITVGSLKKVKRIDRLLSIAKKLKDEGYRFHLYILGRGPLEKEFSDYIYNHRLSDSVTLLGYDSNPYKYVSKCDLFVCSSQTEGFSTAATEALVVGTPVCTVDVSGMREMLGDNNEYGLITENSEEALYEGILSFLTRSEMLQEYKARAVDRGNYFSIDSTVVQVEKTLNSLMEDT